jgi:hypothetical protein
MIFSSKPALFIYESDVVIFSKKIPEENDDWSRTMASVSRFQKISDIKHDIMLMDSFRKQAIDISDPQKFL